MAHSYLTVWSRWRAVGPPYFLAEDKPALGRLKGAKQNCHESWRQYVDCHDFLAENDTALHLGLLPQPFFGNILKARVVVLTLNPGVGPHDYYGEYRDPGLRRALLNSYRQPDRHPSFMWLDPRYSWHGGFAYWHGHLKAVIRTLAKHWEIEGAAAQTRFAHLFACMELCPYHSSSFSVSKRTFDHLRSVELARSFAHDVLRRRAAAGKCLLIVARRADQWGLRADRNIVVYRGSESRAARLTPTSRGGRRILRFLLRETATA